MSAAGLFPSSAVKNLPDIVFMFCVFKVPVHVFLDFSTLECRHLSESVELFVLDLMDATANYINREVKVSEAHAGAVSAASMHWLSLCSKTVS